VSVHTQSHNGKEPPISKTRPRSGCQDALSLVRIRCVITIFACTYSQTWKRIIWTKGGSTQYV